MNLEHWPLERLKPYEHNPRRNDAAIAKMEASIREFGFRVPILALSDGTVVDGHLRLKAAVAMNLETVPVILADHLTPEQVRAFRLLANRSANWASFDDKLVGLELLDLKKLDYDLENTGFTPEELELFLAAVDIPEPDELGDDEEPEPSESVVTQPGDVWICGRHRIVCGDGDTPDDIQKARIFGRWVDLLITRLPDGTDEQLRKRVRTALDGTQGAVYLFAPDTRLWRVEEAFRAAGGHFSTFVITLRSPGPAGAGPHREYDAAIYGWPEGTSHHWCGDRSQGDVWEMPEAASMTVDQAAPVEILHRMIANSSKPGAVVLDLAAGTGAILIACEQLGRKAAAVEADPRAVDVAVRRWQGLTGKQAVNEQGRAFDDVAAGG